MAETVPIFPLSHVLLPGATLPLHIFERRYRYLLDDIADGVHRSAFGVVAIRRGSETSATADFAPVGTMAEIVEQEPHPDGSCDLLTVGSRRFEVIVVDRTTKPYLQATVDWLEEDDGNVVPGLLAACRALCRSYEQALTGLSGRTPPSDYPLDPMRLSYEIAGRLQVQSSDRQDLLAAATAADRLTACLTMLRRETTLLEQTRTVPIAMQALRIVPSSN
ncbi:MAG: LON peptidase substrate-binding domain-containing protein [Actinomycetota bacterium]